METQPTNAAAPEALDARGRAEAVDGEGGARDIKRSLEARASRLPIDVWLSVSALCSVESMLTLETAGKELRNLLRGRSMDAVWRHRFEKAEPALASVLVEGTGRDLCRMYHERCRVRWVPKTANRSPQRGILGVGGWHGQPEHPLDRPRVILVVYDFAYELTWGGTDGSGDVRENELVWVAPPGLSNEWDRDTLDSGMTSCFLVNQQNMVELWRNMSARVHASDSEGVVSLIDPVYIFAFHEQTVPPWGQEDLDILSHGMLGRWIGVKSFDTLLSLDCDLSFSKSEVSGRFRLFDTVLSPDLYREWSKSTEEYMNKLSSMLSCVLNSPAEGRADAADAAPPPPAGLD